MAEPTSGISLWSCLVAACTMAYVIVGIALSVRYGWSVGLAMVVLWFGAGIVAARRHTRR